MSGSLFRLLQTRNFIGLNVFVRTGKGVSGRGYSRAILWPRKRLEPIDRELTSLLGVPAVRS